MRTCAIKSCSSYKNHNNKGEKISLHKFPKNNDICLKWVALMHPKFLLQKSSALCSRHFKFCDFRPTNPSLLKENAVPSLKLNKWVSDTCKPLTPLSTISPDSHKNISDNYEPLKGLSTIFPPTNETLQDPCESETVTNLSTTPLQSHQTILDPCKPLTDLPTTSISANQTINVPPKSTSYKSPYSADNDHTYSVRLMALEEQIKKDKLLKHYKKTVKCLRNKVFSQSNKIKKLQDCIIELENKSSLSGENVNNITDSFGDTPINSIVKTLINFGGKHNPLNNGYSAGMKKFAITLYFYSPEAYKYLRTIICLPSESTVKNWCLDKKLKPGFLKEAFDILEQMEMCQTESLDCE